MAVCRICLSPSLDKYINQLKTNKKDGSKDHSEILLFCLDIQISDELANKEKVCSKCFKTILAFHKFKLMALKNDAYLKSVNPSLPKPYLYQNTQSTSLENVEEVKNYVLVELDKSGRAITPSVLSNEVDQMVDIDDGVEYEDIQHLEPYYLDVNLDTDPDDFSDPKLKYKGKTENAKTRNKRKGINRNTSKKEITTLIAEKRGKPSICDQCGESVKDVKAHVLVHLPKNERQKYPCTVCSKTFFTKSGLGWHNNLTHLGKLGHCEICNKDFKELRAHKLAMHNSEQLRFECGVCNRRFLSTTKLETHIRTHTKDKPFECETCGKKFNQKVVLGIHIRNVHNKEKNFTCKFCQKGFFQKHHLTGHMRTHTKERPYRCNECGKFFTQTSHLRTHMATHSSFRVYPCNLCDMTFKAPSTLYVHKKTHSEDHEQPFRCSHCGMHYKTLGNLQRHVQRHSREQSVLKKHCKSPQKIHKLDADDDCDTD